MKQIVETILLLFLGQHLSKNDKSLNYYFEVVYEALQINSKYCTDLNSNGF